MEITTLHKPAHTHTQIQQQQHSVKTLINLGHRCSLYDVSEKQCGGI